jgi:hypothetical protein
MANDYHFIHGAGTAYILLLENSPVSWYKIFLEKLIVTQLLKEFHALYGTRCFVTVFTRECN